MCLGCHADERERLPRARSIRIAVGRPSDEEVEVSISTENATGRENHEALAKLLDEMNQSTDRTSFYYGLMRRNANRADGSGLGLGRVHAESELDLTCSVVAGVVKLRADGRFPSKKAGVA